VKALNGHVCGTCPCPHLIVHALKAACVIISAVHDLDSHLHGWAAAAWLQLHTATAQCNDATFSACFKAELALVQHFLLCGQQHPGEEVLVLECWRWRTAPAPLIVTL
jgi:hypothetical protein